MTCSACSGRLVPVTFTPAADVLVTLYRCVQCDGLHGSLPREHAGAVVGIGHQLQTNAIGDLRYFDLTLVGSFGSQRAHGWYDTVTRRVVQYG